MSKYRLREPLTAYKWDPLDIEDGLNKLIKEDASGNKPFKLVYNKNNNGKLLIVNNRHVVYSVVPGAYVIVDYPGKSGNPYKVMSGREFKSLFKEIKEDDNHSD